MSENLKFEMLTPAIGALTISQPQRRNALNAAMWAALPGVIERAVRTPGICGLIVRGDGDHFASGADISEFETLYATQASAKKISDDIAAGFKAGGCGLALCCDLRFADNTSKFAITPAKLGLVYPFADVQRLIETVGIPNAKDILMSARLITAKPARKMGLVNQLFKVDNLAEKTLDYAQGLAALSPQSLKITKKMFAAYQAGQTGETAQSEDWFLDGFSSADFREGYRAFLEKRKPDFS